MSNSNEQLDPNDIFSMSEDELSKFDPEKAAAEADALATTEETPEEHQEEIPETEEETEQPEEETTPETDPEQPEETSDNPEDTDPKAQPQKTDPDSSNENAPDYKALYEQIVGKPFKANGRDLTIKSADEAVKLMQMGANYHEKMAALKPVRRVAQMLQQANAMDESTVAFLLDLHNKKPEAIAKLVKDSGIDLYEFDVAQADNYQTSYQAPTDVQMQLNDTIETLATQPGFTEMFNGIAQSWDDASQKFITENPGILGVLQEMNTRGEYQQIMDEVSRRRLFQPELAAQPMLQLFRDTEVRLREAGLLKATATPEQMQQVQQAQAPAVATTTQLKQGTASQTAQARRAAAAPRQAPQTSQRKLTPEDIFSLSPEEFAKIDPSKFN